MKAVSASAAESIADKVLICTWREILDITVIETRKADALVYKSKESFEKAFELFGEGPKYVGPLVIAYLSIANE